MLSLIKAALDYLRIYHFALAAMAYVHGSAHVNPELAASIARAVMATSPLYSVIDDSKERTVSAMVATGAGESSLRSDAIGDGGKSVGPFQIWYGHDLTNQGADEALRQMKVSLAMCGNFATAYLSGGCTNARAQRLAARREALALELYTKVPR
jgi:hypothetical protein